MKKYKIGQTFCFANWVQNKGSLSMFCIALGTFIRRNMVGIKPVAMTIINPQA